MKAHALAAAASWTCVGIVQAQAPLNIEQLMIQPSRLQLGSSLNYRTVQLSPWQSTRQSLWTTGLRYGVARGLEINAGYRHRSVQERVRNDAAQQRYESLEAGVNWRLKAETSLPAVFLELRGSLRARSGDRHQNLSRGEIVLTTYKSIDPTVLSLTLAWEQSRGYRDTGSDYQPGYAWRIEPMMNFAVNPQVTLLGGFAVQKRQALEIDGRPVSLPRERVAARAGIGYAPSPEHTFFLSGDLAADASGTALSLQWLYQF